MQMNEFLTKRTNKIKPSLTLAITAKANKLKSEGVSIVGFGAGEPDFNTPQYIIDAAKLALDKGMTKYTASSGRPDLRKAIAEKLLCDNKLTYAPNQVVVSNGAKHSLFNAIMALVEEGDEVIIPAPYWLTYPELVTLAGGTSVILETKEENGFKIEPAILAKTITSKTKVLILNSPSNPSGIVYSKKEIEEIAKVIEPTNIFVISDEIYEELIYDGLETMSIAAYSSKLYEQTVLVNGLSKAYSMTGWRIGYTASPKWIADAMDAIQSHATSNPNSIAQYASLEALTSEKRFEFLSGLKKEFGERRNLMASELKKLPHISFSLPGGAFYFFINVSKLFGKSFRGFELKTCMDVTDKLLDCGVAVVPGDAFGANNFIRISYSLSSADIVEGIARMGRFIAELN